MINESDEVEITARPGNRLGGGGGDTARRVAAPMRTGRWRWSAKE
ncbi:MAG: hypothetical protein ACYTE5_00875 [Planctomycetota bacterium]